MAKKKQDTRPAPRKIVSKKAMKAVKGGNTGSQSSGAGAGKVTFNPFGITRKVD